MRPERLSRTILPRCASRARSSYDSRRHRARTTTFARASAVSCMCAHTTCTEECRDDRGEPPPAVRLGEHPAPPQQAQHAAADGGDEPGDLDVGRRRSRVEAQEVVLQLVGIGVEPPVGLPVPLDVEEEHPPLAGLRLLRRAEKPGERVRRVLERLVQQHDTVERHAAVVGRRQIDRTMRVFSVRPYRPSAGYDRITTK
jgi:hypothetical protein